MTCVGATCVLGVLFQPATAAARLNPLAVPFNVSVPTEPSSPPAHTAAALSADSPSRSPRRGHGARLRSGHTNVNAMPFVPASFPPSELSAAPASAPEASSSATASAPPSLPAMASDEQNTHLPHASSERGRGRGRGRGQPRGRGRGGSAGHGAHHSTSDAASFDVVDAASGAAPSNAPADNAPAGAPAAASASTDTAAAPRVVITDRRKPRRPAPSTQDSDPPSAPTATPGPVPAADPQLQPADDVARPVSAPATRGARGARGGKAPRGRDAVSARGPRGATNGGAVNAPEPAPATAVPADGQPVRSGAAAHAPAQRPASSTTPQVRLPSRSQNVRSSNPSSGPTAAAAPATSASTFHSASETARPASQALSSSSVDDASRSAPRNRAAVLRTTKRTEELHVLAESLEADLTAQAYDCIVCFSGINRRDSVWSCQRCYRVFHLKCIRKWADASAGVGTHVTSESGWRCPGCQFVHEEFPSKCFCFCGKVQDPVWRPSGPPPHTCGELCGKPRDSSIIGCVHACNIPCHPGPCPPCPVMIQKLCCCGKSTISIRCSAQGSGVCCASICDKLLSCKSHRCASVCHPGPCSPCVEQQAQHCYCGNNTREAVCGSGDIDEKTPVSPGRYSCGNACGRTLTCGNHKCTAPCHKGPCAPCALSPDVLQTCGCGKNRAPRRKSCLDPPFLCGEKCGKDLACAHTTKRHVCASRCHVGACPPCELPVSVLCVCHTNRKEFSALEYRVGPPTWRCETVCNKLKACRRHRCNEACCPRRNDPDPASHECFVLCRKPLRCGQHNCEQLCHAGYCPPCINMIVDEMVCSCGKTVLHPPQACGTRPPICKEPCSKPRPCGHPVAHTCHYDDQPCPPCAVLVTRPCVGGHGNKCASTPCHFQNPTCLQPCGRLLECGTHPCPSKCHPGDCRDHIPREMLAQPLPPQAAAPSVWNEPEAGDVGPAAASLQSARPSCGMKCGALRECGHVCVMPCHPGQPCPAVPCQEFVTAICQCGMRRETVPCLFAGPSLADERELFAKLAIDGEAAVAPRSLPKKSIMCDRLCPTRQRIRMAEERNKKLADALGLVAPDYSTAVRMTYSEDLRAFARRNLPLVRSVEHALDALVCSSKQKQHAFSPMNAEDRRLVGELATLYGLSSAQQDPEPHRSVVAYKGPNSDPFIPQPRLSDTVNSG
eukprot:m.106421 g.106421  ORF g.106421 m.106421 type:complete len:1179 (+) comp8947_c0_seq2:79-3615(+)